MYAQISQLIQPPVPYVFHKRVMEEFASNIKKFSKNKYTRNVTRKLLKKIITNFFN